MTGRREVVRTDEGVRGAVGAGATLTGLWREAEAEGDLGELDRLITRSWGRWPALLALDPEVPGARAEPLRAAEGPRRRMGGRGPPIGATSFMTISPIFGGVFGETPISAANRAAAV